VSLILFIVFIVVPLAELFVIVQVSEVIGVLETIALLILISIAGTWLLKQQGLAAWNRMRQTLNAGRMPNDEIADGAMIMFGGALLLTPGFLTDVLGLVLLIPPTRAVVKRTAKRTLGRKFLGKRIYDARVVRVERGPKPPPATPSVPLGRDPVVPEADSPDRG
jgi:UPF0716 family protein affecting phage T7 exclusion